MNLAVACSGLLLGLVGGIAFRNLALGTALGLWLGLAAGALVAKRSKERGH